MREDWEREKISDLNIERREGMITEVERDRETVMLTGCKLCTMTEWKI